MKPLSPMQEYCLVHTLAASGGTLVKRNGFWRTRVVGGIKFAPTTADALLVRGLLERRGEKIVGLTESGLRAAEELRLRREEIERGIAATRAKGDRRLHKLFVQRRLSGQVPKRTRTAEAADLSPSFQSRLPYAD